MFVVKGFWYVLWTFYEMSLHGLSAIAIFVRLNIEYRYIIIVKRDETFTISLNCISLNDIINEKERMNKFRMTLKSHSDLF